MAALTVTVATAQSEDDANSDARDFDLPAAEAAELVGDGGFDLGDVDFEGSPTKSVAEKWPKDLVIAPISGRSPQLGWTLTLGGGYFLGSNDEESEEDESESPPSVIGGFGMMAENGSYAY